MFNRDDTVAFSFGSKGTNAGQFQFPVRIAIDPNGNVLVTDFYGDGIHLFTHNGQFMQTINSNRPYAIAITPSGYLITGHDGDENKIKVWNPTYQLTNQFGKKGSKKEFFGINGMAINSNGAIYIAEWQNKRLQIINKVLP